MSKLYEFAYASVRESYEAQALDLGVPCPDNDFIEHEAQVLLSFLRDAVDAYFSAEASALPTEARIES